MPLFDYLFVESVSQLLMLMMIIALAGIVRGCIGFGFSALVVASTSFWLDITYVVVMVMIMELIASFFMFKNIKADIDYKLFRILSISGVITSFIGVWLLVSIPHKMHQIILSAYLIFLVLAILARFEFKKPNNTFRLYVIGSIGGFYNGFAAIGGVFVASMLNSSKVHVRSIRATMVVYFVVVEIAFFISAGLNDLFNQEVVISSAVFTLPMLFGIYVGSKLFMVLSEKVLKKIVLVALLILSLVGLIRVLST